MWKIAVGFIIFAAISMFVIIKGGDTLDMGGEKHGEPLHTPEVVPVAPAAPASATQ